MKNKKSGIYKIQNIMNGNIYIGSAVDLDGRKRTHFSSLKKQRHHSIILQKAYNKYGKDNFNFTIIEECGVSELIKREQYYIDKLKPKYNICKIAGNTLGYKGTKEGNLKKSLNNKRKGKFGKDNPSSKIIYQYDLNGSLIKKWYGAVEIQRTLGLDPGNIRFAIKNKWCNYDFCWSYKYRGTQWINHPKRWDRSKTKKPILMFDLENNLIKKFKSAKDATKYLNKGEGALSLCLKGKAKTAYNYKWKYDKKIKKYI